MRLCAAAAFAFALTGCLADPTELVLVVQSDLAPTHDIDRVVIHLTSPAGASGHINVPLQAPDAPGFPLTLALTPVGEALSPVVLATEAYDGERLVVRAEAVTSFVAFERRAVPLSLSSGCVGVTCDGDDAVCVLGQCVDRRIPGRALPAAPATF